ncbi:SET and MYND domain-containing protein 4-like [Dorcoceras hygrometricum]|uniref:SET and MYND domain-containing protein 4-like n=1 Tax=Dorcoceras hygrometricum TaxID=472368 RepID=A0A2Z7B8I9_9LAMI|nr:SET and MYND domain-containing protein 4-like [Dorcoceras hygrometricum]
MEKLKSAIPETLKRDISDSTPNSLHSTCSSLLDFYQNLPLFHQLVRDLTDPEMGLCGKNKEAALEAKANGNACFSNGDFSNALRFYSQALHIAPTDVDDGEKNLVATLYLNRASSLHKLGFSLESSRDCSRALKISPAYAKAWFRRAKANASLGNHDDAINDLKISLETETSLSGKRQIQRELNIILDHSGKRSSMPEESYDNTQDEPLQVELQCAFTPTKGRGMTSYTDVPQASLIHKEDPYAAIILKHCRETHCHFCFNGLPVDAVSCISCSIPFYCSTKCQMLAEGCGSFEHKKQPEFLRNITDDLEDYVRNVTSLSITSSELGYDAEHKHECQGVLWPAVLPSDVVLAGRVLVKHIQQQSYDGAHPKIHAILDLCQNYEKLSNESKLELHVYAVILLCCLQKFYASKLPFNSVIISEIIMLLSQIRVNSMAIVRMKYSDANQTLDSQGTMSVEQVRVAQAVYSGGSLFNHSCQPNVHTFFLSRTLFIQTTEYVTAGSQLELSYGPQVGQLNCFERRQLLEDRYSFICQCRSCAQVNLSDLVINAYRCVKPTCSGVVLDSSITKYENEKIRLLKVPNSLQGYMHDEDISTVASHLCEEIDDSSRLEAGHCLSCGSYRDIQATQKTISEAESYIGRLQDTIAGSEVSNNTVRDAIKSIDILKTFLHPFNKKVAEAEDNIAQALCLAGDFQAAMDHCQASIEVTFEFKHQFQSKTCFLFGFSHPFCGFGMPGLKPTPIPDLQ